MKISDYEQYYQKGGTYVLPIEVFNELWGEMENWKDTCKQKENTIKEIREIMKRKGYYHLSTDEVDYINSLLDKENK